MDLTIRLARPSDAAAFVEIYRPAVEGSAISFESETPSLGEMEARIEGILPTHPWLAACVGDLVVGYAYGSPHRARAGYRWSVETSAYVAADARRVGAGRALYRELFRILETQGYRRAFAGITLPNAASVGFHESLGFTAIGVFERIGYKLDSWHDVGWWQRDLGDAHAVPTEPLPLAELRSSLSLG